jgi:hypothetical protein
MMETKLDVGELLRATAAAISSRAAGAVGYVLALGALGSALDLAEVENSFLDTIASLVGGYLLLRAMLQGTGNLEINAGQRFGGYFGLSILSGLGILLGFVVLIIPGLVLMVRWLPAYAILLAEGTTVTGALGESWRRTAGHFWPLLAASLMVLLLAAASMAVYVSNEFFSVLPTTVSLVAGNLMLAATGMVFTALGVATYRLSTDQSEGLSEVFA